MIWVAQVCLNKLEDLQLAMVVVRLHEGDLDSLPEHLQRLLEAEVLGQADGGTASLALAHPDPFLRSMALWQLQRYEDALTTLLQTNVGHQHHRQPGKGTPEPSSADTGQLGKFVRREESTDLNSVDSLNSQTST